MDQEITLNDEDLMFHSPREYDENKPQESKEGQEYDEESGDEESEVDEQMEAEVVKGGEKVEEQLLMNDGIEVVHD